MGVSGGTQNIPQGWVIASMELVFTDACWLEIL